MIIKTVSYNKIYSSSAFLNERIGIEVALNEGDDAKEALKLAQATADQYHKETNPELYKHNVKPLSVEETDIVKNIELCDTMQKLGRLKNSLTVNTKPYYMEKLKTLTNNHTNQ